ncbi:hypothetical protein ZEAMMB73_Zm00001d004722 [Zea mays]|uniref:Uncharacterized protein n=1 Tax=Zea mays TaxID=4577 RepID=A0A1D6EH79_MAIZE|nr:hypothetical protein ZEAMMB73_Zm00001d004722 [Zea mays]
MTAREPRGFGFIQYFGPEDASDANGRGRSYDGRLRSRSPRLNDSPGVDHDPKAETTRQHLSESTIQGYLNVYYVLGIPKYLMSEVGCEPMNLDVGCADQCAGAYVV